MSAKSSIATGLAVFGLITGATFYFTPRTSTAELENDRRQQQVEQLSDAHEQANERRREQGLRDGDAHRLEKLRPSEVRPRLPLRLGR